jgi:SAM-dependent methyltransferase
MVTPRNHPIFSFVYERLARQAERFEGQFRDEVCGQAEGLILEVGSGTGMSFGHYARGRRVIALEPEPNMLRRSRPRTATSPVPVTLVRASAAALPFADGTFDTAIASLVLCSVPDLHRAVGEIRRALKPGGVLRFYEHVRAANPRTAWWQDRLERPWGLFAGGCHPNRDTVGTLLAEGFRVRFRSVDLPMPGRTFLPHVIGEARAT